METKQTLVNEICPTTTQGRVKKGALLVDVRERDEVEQISWINVNNLTDYQWAFNHDARIKERISKISIE